MTFSREDAGVNMMRKLRKYLLLPLLLLLPVAAPAGSSGQLIDDFENGLRPRWKEKSFEGHTDYRVVEDDGGHCLQARSEGAASGLVFEKEYDLSEFPILGWRWRIDHTITGGDETKKSGDDYAARVYVVFPHWFFPKTKTINYIWANKLPKGKAVPNPFTGNAIMVAVESGGGNAGQWRSVRRNVYRDYRRLFGGEPPEVGAIAIMTDTDNTGESAVACYDDIRIEKE